MGSDDYRSPTDPAVNGLIQMLFLLYIKLLSTTTDFALDLCLCFHLSFLIVYLLIHF